ncbi:hypothetical protein MSAS_52050 [Mycobacterium saskatchewanense]|uniref:hypothetical protein n=1 Tax=Mycobacterium saskatchewanense TaxID=220927 RepID=UPI00138BC971|nr:hypothetical protein [Mycobacterium saskatchewanense]BBX66031.1 hypothetical protein MSAS_52050 [Mycobacterium saskatchewanense]
MIAAAAIVAALTGGTGVALASPDPGQQPDIPTIDEWQIQFPTTMTNPQDESGPTGDWGGVGMYCENLFAHCG